MLNTGKLLRQNLFCKAALVAAIAPWPVLAAPLPDAAKIDFEFELPKIDTSMYARPYVAVWVEDEQRQSVKTIQLWVGKDEWLKDMRSWWRKVGRYDRELIDAVTAATRPAGQYRFVWDGTNDAGERLEQGDYTLHVEVVREHGGRNYLRQKMTLADSEVHYQLKPTQETGVITVHYQVK